MKRIAIVLILFVLTVGFLTGCGGDRDDTTIFSVNDVQDDPLAFSGEITINGIVSEFVLGNSAVFGIEYTMRRPCCPSDILYVEYIGNEPMPAIGDEVNVTGSWGEELEAGRFVFQATSFEIRGAR